jgi:hypothetical protein
MRHQVAIEHSEKLTTEATKIQSKWRSTKEERNVALYRLLLAAARKHHQERLTFQRRVAEESAQMAAGEPTIWRLHQASSILREALQDVLYAVRACSKSQGFMHSMATKAKHHRDQEAQDRVVMQKTAQEHAQVKALDRQIKWRLLASGVASKLASDTKLAIQQARSEAEAEWYILHSSLED